VGLHCAPILASIRASPTDVGGTWLPDKCLFFKQAEQKKGRLQPY
jgi:hypothetical protein